MPIETRRPRKGKRLTIIQPMPGDLRDIVIGSGYDPGSKKGMLVISEIEHGLIRELFPLRQSLQALQDENNCVVMLIHDINTCDTMIKKLQQIKSVMLAASVREINVSDSTWTEGVA